MTPWKQSEFRVYVRPKRRVFWHGFHWSLFYGPMRDLQEPVGKGWVSSYDGAVVTARRRMIGLIVASHNREPTLATDGNGLVRAADNAYMGQEDA